MSLLDRIMAGPRNHWRERARLRRDVAKWQRKYLAAELEMIKWRRRYWELLERDEDERET